MYVVSQALAKFISINRSVLIRLEICFDHISKRAYINLLSTCFSDKFFAHMPMMMWARALGSLGLMLNTLMNQSCVAHHGQQVSLTPPCSNHRIEIFSRLYSLFDLFIQFNWQYQFNLSGAVCAGVWFKITSRVVWETIKLYLESSFEDSLQRFDASRERISRCRSLVRTLQSTNRNREIWIIMPM